MNIATTNGITVSVATKYEPEHSQPIRGNFIFTYYITVQNQSPHTVQLLRRHWHIVDGFLVRREVKGDGVIGKTPILHAGEQFEYQSWTEIFGEMGMMFGTFTVQRQSDGGLMDIEIPRFLLIPPLKQN